MEASFIAIQLFGQLFPAHPFTLAEGVGKVVSIIIFMH